MVVAGLRRALDALRDAGCRTAWINGSFVTDKPWPSDYDGCWEEVGVDFARLDPVFRDLSHPRAAQKQKFGGEFFPANAPADTQLTKFRDFFQRTKELKPKGIIVIDLEHEP